MRRGSLHAANLGIGDSFESVGEEHYSLCKEFVLIFDNWPAVRYRKSRSARPATAET